MTVRRPGNGLMWLSMCPRSPARTFGGICQVKITKLGNGYRLSCCALFTGRVAAFLDLAQFDLGLPAGFVRRQRSHASDGKLTQTAFLGPVHNDPTSCPAGLHPQTEALEDIVPVGDFLAHGVGLESIDEAFGETGHDT